MSLLRSVLFSLALSLPGVACIPGGSDNKDTGSVDGGTDLDSDGFDTPQDCDDSDATVHPGAQEICDGIDNNCDDQVDESLLSTYFADLDLDGHGDPAAPIQACAESEGVVTSDSDCDDTNESVHPDAPELCDGLDNDCDKVIDQDLKTLDWYRDLDEDSYGDPLDVQQDCAAPEGYVERSGDCDDSDDAIHPEAVEVCDGWDNDCDDEVDEAGAEGELLVYLDEDLDGYGRDDTWFTTCAAPSGYALLGGDCDDSSAEVNPGAIEICDTLDTDQDCDGLVDDLDTVADEDKISYYADSDVDGYGDQFAEPVLACDPEEYQVDNNLDCDDENPDISPGADETCNTIDDDCDGLTDNDAMDAITWHHDADGDTYGDPLDVIVQCFEPEEYVVDGTDCDDTDRDINPTYGCGAAAHDGVYTGTFVLLATVSGLSLSDSCSCDLSLTMDIDTRPDLRGSCSCPFTGPLASFGSLSMRFDGNISTDPYIDGTVMIGSETDTWEGAFSADSLEGDFDGSFLYGPYTLSYEGAFALSR